MTVAVRTISRCRSCGSDRLEDVLSLGNLCISDFVTDPTAEPDRAPLTLVYCVDCTMVQLRDTADRDRLYRTYYYRSGVNETMVAALKDVVDDALGRVILERADWVLDIGANDGTLMLQYGHRCIHRMGVEPSKDMVRIAEGTDAGVVVEAYFPLKNPFSWMSVFGGPAKIITSIAQFYNVDNPNEYVAAVKDFLHPDGVWIVQFQDLASMLRCNGVDNVCHEHITYPSRQSMTHLLRRHGLAIDTWSEHAVNGGSLRLVVKHEGKARQQAAVPETDQGWRRALQVFAAKTEANKYDVLSKLHLLKTQGWRVFGYAASTKANTLLQYYGIGPDLIEAFAERSPEKWGRYTVGTNIPIVSEDAMRLAKPDALLVGAWQFADAFARRESAMLAAGTRMIVPLPRLHTLGSEAFARAA